MAFDANAGGYKYAREPQGGAFELPGLRFAGTVDIN